MGDLEARPRGCLAEDVVPDRVERAAVEELGAGARRLRGKPAEEAPSLLRERPLRPADGDGGVAVEVVDRQGADDRQVVVAGEAERRILLDPLAAAVRLGPVADDVAEAPELVGGLRRHLGQNGRERVVVPVDVRDDGDSHRLPERALTLAPPQAGGAGNCEGSPPVRASAPDRPAGGRGGDRPACTGPHGKLRRRGHPGRRRGYRARKRARRGRRGGPRHDRETRRRGRWRLAPSAASRRRSADSPAARCRSSGRATPPTATTRRTSRCSAPASSGARRVTSPRSWRSARSRCCPRSSGRRSRGRASSTSGSPTRSSARCSPRSTRATAAAPPRKPSGSRSSSSRPTRRGR